MLGSAETGEGTTNRVSVIGRYFHALSARPGITQSVAAGAFRAKHAFFFAALSRSYFISAASEKLAN